MSVGRRRMRDAPRLTKARFSAMVERATVDAYGDAEQITGWFTMIEGNLTVPFETLILGVPATIERVDPSRNGQIVGICRRGRAALTLGSCHLFLVLLFIGVVIVRMTQLILIVDLELLGGFGALVDRAHRRLILTRMFIVSVIVVIVSTTRRVRGENQSLKLAQGVEFWVYGGHARILINIKGSQAHSGPLGEYPPM
jgi:hypothetical protein